EPAREVSVEHGLAHVRGARDRAERHVVALLGEESFGSRQERPAVAGCSSRAAIAWTGRKPHGGIIGTGHNCPVSVSHTGEEHDMADFDHTYDVVVVGTGAAGMATALGAADKGLRVLMLESTGTWGGNTAMSGGGMWLPNN